MSDDEEWLESLGPGDRVAVTGRFGGLPSLGTVERTTKTQIILSNGSRWRRSSGRQVGEASGYGNSYLRKVTAKDIDLIKRRRLYSEVSDALYNRDKLTTDQLRQMHEIIFSNNES